ncbi:MAG: NAD(P)-binding domain-containing protein [Planctomycetes bacterium]|nr:NAD(P)-binding domain-containing protein [Planctomycetota bacterium]MBI3848162.1 NAD(P)-binding domain-containing protein [Planctomycetota bacterium]
MEPSHWLFVCAALAVLFIALALWQRAIDRRHATRVVAEIHDARERGTNRAIAQHPTVDPLQCIGCGSCVAACPEEGVLGLVDGIAHVIHASRCVGHAHCEVACPVGAISVGLGDITKRPDIPIVRENLESTVPGIYVAGELGGIALIRHAVLQGTRAVEDIARQLREQPERDRDLADLLVVGAGPAGLSASLKAIEFGLRHLTIDQDEAGGTIRKYPRRKLTLTQPVEIPLYGRLTKHEYMKEDLLRLWEGIVRDFQVPIRRPVKLLSLRGEKHAFVAETSAGFFRSRFVVLALGRRGTPRRLGVPGEESDKVLYQIADAASYTGQRILVVGGGDSAVEAAMGLASQPGNVVTISYRKQAFFRLKARNDERVRDFMAKGRIRALFSSEVTAIENDSVTLRAEDGDRSREIRIPNDHVFVMAGGEPPFALLREIGLGFGADGSNAPIVGRAAVSVS